MFAARKEGAGGFEPPRSRSDAWHPFLLDETPVVFRDALMAQALEGLNLRLPGSGPGIFSIGRSACKLWKVVAPAGLELAMDLLHGQVPSPLDHGTAGSIDGDTRG